MNTCNPMRQHAHGILRMLVSQPQRSHGRRSPETSFGLAEGSTACQTAHPTRTKLSSKSPSAPRRPSSASRRYWPTTVSPINCRVASGSQLAPKIGNQRSPYFSGGIENHQVGGTTLRMYTIAKTLADAFRNQRLIDRSVAIEALKAAVEQRKTTPSAIAEAARTYGAWNQMRPYLEAVTSNG